MRLQRLAMLYQFLLLFSCTAAQSWTKALCSSENFVFPALFGAELLQITANEAFNFTTFSLLPGTDETGLRTIDFCNITVTYTHPGWNDVINVQIWLPLDSWSGRLHALGGGGYSASLGGIYLAVAVANGDAAIGTDSGHLAGIEGTQSPESWALTSPGNVNLYLLEDFSSRTLHELAVIGKSVTKDFYGKEPQYSYFNGCSQGGRQGLMIAQRYPEDFDGILASAPAINGETLLPAAMWALQTMKNLNYWPSPCEVDAFTQAAIEECDMLDGVKDGIISNPELCHFQAASVVGKQYECGNSDRIYHLSNEGARVVEAAWQGPYSPSGDIGWYGLSKDASLTTTYVRTECSSDGRCMSSPTELVSSWSRFFIAKDPNFNITAMSDDQFFSHLKQSRTEYKAMIGTDNPDLSEFQKAGAKMITWHGLADQVIPPNGTFAYYQRVMDKTPEADTFYRVFAAPGVGHCFGGNGPIPNRAFGQLVAWVENGVVPETLLAVDAQGHTRKLCPYPYQQVYIGGDATNPKSFVCRKRILSPSDHKVLNQFPLL